MPPAPAPAPGPPPAPRTGPADGSAGSPADAVASAGPGAGGAARSAGGRGVAERLLVRRETVVHRLPAHCKLVALLGFVLLVVATPREAMWAFGGHALLLAAVAVAARVPPGLLLRRMLVEVPFVAFALLLPLLAEGPRIGVLGLSLSEPGLWSAWNILAKATLGVTASVLLAATTDVRQLLLGLERLRLPPLLVQIAAFMIRYLDVVTGELRRMRIARESRGFTARGPRHWGVLARTAGALFIRCYERGERVHLAMLSRGYRGSMPVPHRAPAGAAAWARALALPGAALVLCLLALATR